MKTVKFTPYTGASDRSFKMRYQCSKSGDQSGEYVRAEVARELLDALQRVTDHLAGVLSGPAVSGAGITFANGVEGVPTITQARKAIAKAESDA